MKKEKIFIQTSEIVKEVMISVFENAYPELPKLNTSPILCLPKPEKPAWLWLLPDGRCLSYFGTEFSILRSFPVQNKIIIQMEGMIDAVYPYKDHKFKAYQAEYNVQGGVSGKGMIIELNLSNFNTKELLRLYDRGLVFEVSRKEWIRPILSNGRVILQQVLKNFDKEDAQ